MVTVLLFRIWPTIRLRIHGAPGRMHQHRQRYKNFPLHGGRLCRWNFYISFFVKPTMNKMAPVNWSSERLIMMMVVFKIAWLASCRPLCLGCCSRAYLRSLVDGQEMKIPCPHSAGCKHTVVILHVLFKFLHHKIKRNDVGHFFLQLWFCDEMCRETGVIAHCSECSSTLGR